MGEPHRIFVPFEVYIWKAGDPQRGMGRSVSVLVRASPCGLGRISLAYRLSVHTGSGLEPQVPAEPDWYVMPRPVSALKRQDDARLEYVHWLRWKLGPEWTVEERPP